MKKFLFIILVLLFVTEFKEWLPDPIVQVVEQVQMVLLGILFVIGVFLIAPAWVGMFAVVVVGAWLYMEAPTQGISGNGNGDTAQTTQTVQDECDYYIDPCCGAGLCITITGQPASQLRQ
jgi:hypothetical protein